MHEPFLEQTAGMNVVSCSANMVLVIHFWIPKKKMRKYKIYIYIYIYIKKKIFGRNPKNNRSEKRMLECRPKLVEEIQKCKRLKFDSESPVDKENSI
jgi:hypothetical protein